MFLRIHSNNSRIVREAHWQFFIRRGDLFIHVGYSNFFGLWWGGWPLLGVETPRSPQCWTPYLIIMFWLVNSLFITKTEGLKFSVNPTPPTKRDWHGPYTLLWNKYVRRIKRIKCIVQTQSGRQHKCSSQINFGWVWYEFYFIFTIYFTTFLSEALMPDLRPLVPSIYEENSFSGGFVVIFVGVVCKLSLTI